MSDDVTISAAIMAHPVRHSLVVGLVESLDADAEIAWATNRSPSAAPEARWRTGAAAWGAVAPGATHHLVLQDDAVICRDLIAGLTRALDETPGARDVVVSVYYGNHHGPTRVIDADAHRAAELDASWVVSTSLRWGVAVLAPVAHVKPMLSYCERLNGHPYDSRLARYWLHAAARRCWYTWPGLVDHDDSVPSLVGHTRGRTAHRFCGRDTSALDLEWAGPIIDRRLARQ